MSHPLAPPSPRPEPASPLPRPEPGSPPPSPEGVSSPPEVAVRDALERWRERGQGLLAGLGMRLASEAGRVRARATGGSRILRQGLAALERGNLEAAFWLLREEVAERPDHTPAVQAFWNVSVRCGRAEAAAAALGRVVQREAADDPERAAEVWRSLDAEAPDTPVDALTLARLLPVLKARVAAAPGDEAREEARHWLVRALRRCVEPGSGLEGGVALRVFEEARELDREAAVRAAKIALASPNLHEAKRARLESFVSRCAEGAPAAAPRA